MKLLEQFVRQVLTEGARGPEELQVLGGFVIVQIDEDMPDRILIFYASDEEDLQSKAPNGQLQMVKVKDHSYYAKGGPAAGAYMVELSGIDSGWGPLLYDIAMEVATSLGSGLTSDRGTVSQFAKKVWDFYQNNRTKEVGGSLTYSQLDDTRNSLTPSDEDNSIQTASQKWSGEKWSESSLSKVYYSSGTPVIDKLKSLDLIEFSGVSL
jgi:hypothetical protein